LEDQRKALANAGLFLFLYPRFFLMPLRIQADTLGQHQRSVQRLLELMISPTGIGTHRGVKKKFNVESLFRLDMRELLGSHESI
jgi:hypothetical protein